MAKGFYIIGTDTEVGKTVIAAGLMHLLLKEGYNAAYFKPVASGELEINGRRAPADAAFVSAASGFHEDFRQVTPFSFPDEVAPHLAARIAGRSIDREGIVSALAQMKTRYDVIVGEGAGGLMVPLDDNGWLQYELIREMGFSCLLAVRAGLGTINHTLLTLSVAREAGLKVNGIVINGAGASLVEQDNIIMIRKLSGVAPVFVLPRISGMSPEKLEPGNLRDVFEKSIAAGDIAALMDEIGLKNNV